jgi:probable HAF family extracellular repeat protein
MFSVTTLRLHLAAGALGLCSLLLGACGHAGPKYSVTVLGTPAGFATSGADGINASGQVVGWAVNAAGYTYAVMWTGTTPTLLGNLHGITSMAYGIDDAGHVAGYACTTTATDGNSEAVVWTTGTIPTVLGNLNHPYNKAVAISTSANGADRVAGYLTLPGDKNLAVAWSGTTPSILPHPPGSFFSIAAAINPSGQVAGQDQVPSGPLKDIILPVRWTGTDETILDIRNGGGAEALGINAQGDVAGVVLFSSPPSADSGRAVIWTGTTPTFLGTMGGNYSQAVAINDSGDVAGSYVTSGPNGASYPFLYSGGTMYDLGSLLPPGSGVTGLSISGHCINNSRQIAATGIIGGQQCALRLSPAPSPP